MDGRGMHAVDNPSSLFIEDVLGDEGGHAKGVGVAHKGGAAVLGVAMMGSRPVLLEVQVGRSVLLKVQVTHLAMASHGEKKHIRDLGFKVEGNRCEVDR
jgi:hypothetical protein